MAVAVAVPAGRVSAARVSSTAVSAGYVPDGLTAQQWEDMKKKKATDAAKRKKEVASKKFEVGCGQQFLLLRREGLSLGVYGKRVYLGGKHGNSKCSEICMKSNLFWAFIRHTPPPPPPSPISHERTHR